MISISITNYCWRHRGTPTPSSHRYLSRPNGPNPWKVLQSYSHSQRGTNQTGPSIQIIDNNNAAATTTNNSNATSTTTTTTTANHNSDNTTTNNDNHDDS